MNKEEFDNIIDDATEMLSDKLGLPKDKIPRNIVESAVKRASIEKFDEFVQSKDEVMLAINNILKQWKLDFALIVWSPISGEDGILSSIDKTKMTELLKHYLDSLENGRFKKAKIRK